MQQYLALLLAALEFVDVLKDADRARNSCPRIAQRRDVRQYVEAGKIGERSRMRSRFTTGIPVARATFHPHILRRVQEEPRLPIYPPRIQKGPRRIVEVRRAAPNPDGLLVVVGNDAVPVTGIDPGRHDRDQLAQVFLRDVEAMLHILVVGTEFLIGLRDVLMLLPQRSQGRQFRRHLPAQAVALRLGVLQNTLGEHFMSSQPR